MHPDYCHTYCQHFRGRSRFVKRNKCRTKLVEGRLDFQKSWSSSSAQAVKNRISKERNGLFPEQDVHSLPRAGVRYLERPFCSNTIKQLARWHSKFFRRGSGKGQAVNMRRLTVLLFSRRCSDCLGLLTLNVQKQIFSNRLSRLIVCSLKDVNCVE